VVRVAAIRPPGLDQAEAVYAALRAYEDMQVHRELAAGREELLTGYVRDLLLAVPPPADPDRQQELNQAAADIRARIGIFMREWPILLLPVASVPAYKRGVHQFVVHGTTLIGPQVEGCCRAVTLLGAPSAVVRCGYSADGFPVGVQVVARPFHDAEAVAVAMELERRLGPAFPGVRSGR
jgi:amidase